MRFYTSILILLTLSVLLTVAQYDEQTRIKRRMYAMCPPKFQRIGADCYAISDQRMNWLEAHFQCKDKNSKLAEPNKNADRKLRSFFEKMDHDPDDIWIGATYDWHSKLWQWSISGKNLTYDAFSQMDPESRKNLEYHCAVFNPSLKYRWSARSCVDKHRYICQHKMPKVSEKNRNKVYARWNQTFPDQLANEVLLEVIDTKGKDGKRIHRRVKPVDSGENYPIRVDRRPTQMRRRRPARLPETFNDITVSFIPNDQTNEINGASQYYPTSSSTPLPIVMKFIPGDLQTPTGPDVQAAQAYPDMIVTRPPETPRASPANNETVDKPNRRPPGQRKRVRNNFDKIAEQKRRKERERKRAMHLRRKQQREERQRAKEAKEEEEKRKQQQQQAELDDLKQKQAEEEKLLKEQELTNQARREKLAADREISEREQERKEAEKKMMEEQRLKEEEQRHEEVERARKQRLHEENRLHMEQEARIQEKENERERQLEEEKRISEENRRRAEEEEERRQEELKRLQEEDEKRLELQRVQLERKREEEELARLEEENRKRIAAQKAREDEIRRREEELARQEAEEKRLQEELKIREEQDRQLQQEKAAREAEEKRQKEEQERRDQEYQEQLRREKEEKIKKKIEEETKQLQEEEEERKRKERAQKYVERISRLSPEARAIFLQARQRRKKNKNLDNEVTIPERK